MTQTRNNEIQILRRIVEALAADESITYLAVDDGGDEDALLLPKAQIVDEFASIVEACFAVDDCHIRVKRAAPQAGSFVYFIWGNGNDGWDAVTDYGVSLEETLRPVFDWIDEQENV